MRKLTGMTLIETRLAVLMLAPALLIVFAIILFPVAAGFWISFKPVTLGDLRPPAAVVREQVVRPAERAGDTMVVRYRVRNSSRNVALSSVVLEASIPPGFRVTSLPEGFSTRDGRIVARFDSWPGGFNETYTLGLTARPGSDPSLVSREPTGVKVSAQAPNVLTNLTFTLKNYAAVLSGRQFWPAFWATVSYTVFGSIGAIVLGLFAATLLNRKFTGRGLLRGLFLFPYVAPVIAMAFTWTFFLDPFNGTLNSLLVTSGLRTSPILFLSEQWIDLSILGIPLRLPLALSTVIAFESWRYFPFAFLFILARLQAIDDQLYEAADLDGVSPLQKYWYITIPQLFSVLSTLFLLRFMWTFNKFDDVFLLTGGAAGTRTLPIEVYDNAFGRADIGAGAATAVVLFGFLAVFLIIYFRTIAREEENRT